MTFREKLRVLGIGATGAVAIAGQVEAADLDVRGCFKIAGAEICLDTGNGYYGGHNRPYPYEPPRTVNRRVATVPLGHSCPPGSVGKPNGNTDQYGRRMQTCWVEVLKR